MASNWAIVIGINHYRFLQPLSYAKRDAEAMSEFLRQEAQFDRIFLFTDDSPPIGDKITEPFRNNLLRVLRQIFAQPFMKDGDNFWFFFSGHGIRHDEQDYLMPLDGDPEDVENTGIPTQLISSYLRSCGADNVVMILDACRSDGKKSGQGIGKQTEAAARQTGVISIFSCSPYEYSYELESIGQGAFTHTLIEGLGVRGRCATVERLNQYLQNQVPQLVQQLGNVRQTPYTIAEPLNRSHLILMPQYASLADIATLKNDAYRAERRQDWGLAKRLWVRVNAAASGQDIEAVEALQNLGNWRVNDSAPHQSHTNTPKSNRLGLFDYRVEVGLNETSSNNEPVSPPPPVDPQYKKEFFRSGNTPSSLRSSENEFSSALFGDGYYANLGKFLAEKQWKEADKETSARMLAVIGKDRWWDVNSQDFQNFPCQDLCNIDQLWSKYSGGKFGFSIQKKIYLKCGAKPDGKYPGDKIWSDFGIAVGWRNQSNNRWVDSSSIVFSITAPNGHLPSSPGVELVSQMQWKAHYIFGLNAVKGFGYGVTAGGKRMSSLIQRLVNCNFE